jgi:predicted heme/steroid binding protein
MKKPERVITLRELRLYNGEDNDRLYVAYKGVVYDVTDCPKWRRGVHEGLHFPGQDLSIELDNQAPHAGGVFSHPCVVVIGRLMEDYHPNTERE